MPRHKRLRKVVEPPKFKGYKPYGCKNKKPEQVDLLYEEYEALKLADYDHLNHLEASVLMGISRPTFARIYDTARKKIATALVEAREIRTVFGNAFIDKSWFVCKSCESNFNIPLSLNSAFCPMCKSEKIESLNNPV